VVAVSAPVGWAVVLAVVHLPLVGTAAAVVVWAPMERLVVAAWDRIHAAVAPIAQARSEMIALPALP